MNDKTIEDFIDYNIIGYFLVGGGDDKGDDIRMYIWKRKGFSRFLSKHVYGNAYGKDLELLLIQYYVDGPLKAPNMPIKAKIRNYSNKNKDIAVAFPVTPDRFHDAEEPERRRFVVGTTLDAIDLVETRLGKRKLDIDFARLRSDVFTASQEFLKQPGRCDE